MHQPLLGCVTLGYSLSLSELPLHVSRLPRVSELFGREAFGCSPREMAGFGQGWNWGAGRTGFREAWAQVAKGEVPFPLLPPGMNFTFFSKDWI